MNDPIVTDQFKDFLSGNHPELLELFSDALHVETSTNGTIELKDPVGTQEFDADRVRELFAAFNAFRQER